ncbi:hypothetical protein O1611_g8955 [Lasiodiplodia mahajangana]|uniref:Uncharacterized protein n=1 Tax=Lasiodiplodia mahajangana TaxID=1108764 RepID=A0ACC2JB14_9PEZI|nr:hypothetical protein O1611_g8955 [Lasiodiplodia mahajangana]
MLEALLVKRISPALQMQVSAVSDQTLRNGGTILGMVQYDEGRYGVEGLASSDGGLLGIRGLYNFGGDVAGSASPNNTQEPGNGLSGPERERIYGRFSAGGELYYGTLNKSGGMSLGARYESAWSVGMELWRKKGAWAVDTDIDGEASDIPSLPTYPLPQRSFQAKMEWRMDDPLPLLDTPDLLRFPEAHTAQPHTAQESTVPERTAERRTFRAKLDWRQNHEGEDEDLYSGVLKARLDHHWRMGLLWEGRIKSLLFSLGSGIDLRRPDSPFRTLGLEVQFSS